MDTREFAMALYSLEHDAVTKKHVGAVRRLCRNGRVNAKEYSGDYLIFAEIEDGRPVVRAHGHYTALQRKAAAKRAERRKRYESMTNDELSEAWSRLLDEYADRLEYFAALPEWQTPGNVALMKDNPDAWGLSRGEFMEWCGAILDHSAESLKICSAAEERRRRLREAERRRVAALPSHDDAMAAYEAHEPSRPATWHLMPGETMRGYVDRVERDRDADAVRDGAWDGQCEVREREDRELLEALTRGTGTAK